MKIIARYFNIHYLYYYFVLFLIIIYLGSWLTAFSPFKNFSFYVVVSNSMAPTITKYSWIIVKKTLNYNIGAVVTYHYQDQKNHQSSTITHRVIEKKNYQNQTLLLIKGDANQDNDGWINQKNIVGEVKYVLPMIGGLVKFLQTQSGKFIGIYLPISLIFHKELKSIIVNKTTT